MAGYITEVKRHLNKPDQSFRCEVLSREEGHLVLRYVSDREGRVGGEVFPSGSTTVAHYWEGRGYVGWRMHGPDGTLRGHLFHFCRDVRIGPDSVEYLDLLLDLWVSADGGLTVLDEDELADCVTEGRVSPGDLAWIASERQGLTERLGSVLTEMA